MNDFDFSVAMSIAEFFTFKEVEKQDRKWTVKNCHSEEGNTFPALMLRNGETTEAGRPAVSCFALSKALQEQGVDLNPTWVNANKSDIMLINAEDVNTADGHDAKFGIIYLNSESDWNVWED